ncbi:hypothetical protein C4D60_Mb00t17280 [Musa balbisiana]|uniref:Uncharacterized protein n=1 Tax=Musa balbisiana TaxID=52838 RepID=A0A4S8I405_MUSBA|nr:hypothetical protein C4D60_Mb00t17280 [Musa balbisiana]
MAKEGKSATLRLPSGEVRLISKKLLSNSRTKEEYEPVDLHMGAVSRESPIGQEKKPTTPWGYPALGRRSRKKEKKI